MRPSLKTNGYGLSVIGKLKETRIKRNLYYEIKDKLVEENISNGQVIRKTKKTKVYGLHSTKEVRDNLIELLTERVRHHKDKFIAPILYEEMRGLEVKKNGKVEHSDLTHDDSLFSYLMAMYVWYEGKNLRENFGLEKRGIKTEDAVDDILEMETSTNEANFIEPLKRATAVDGDKFEAQLAMMEKAKGMLFGEYLAKQRAMEDQKLKLMLQNPVIREAYARNYGIPASAVSIDTDSMGASTIPDSLFTDFNKDYSEMDEGSVYKNIYMNGDLNPNEMIPYENESLQ